MRLSLILAALFCTITMTAAPARAGDVTHDAALALKKPRKGDARSGPPDKVELKIFIPEGVTVIRGAIVNPFYLDTIGQKHWQEACRLWGFALIGANYFGVQSAEFKETLQTAMEDFATQSKHPELRHIPFCFNGMSAGAGMSRSFAAAIPERTLAVAGVCLEAAPDLPALRPIPFLTIFGEKDGGQMKLIMSKLPVHRKDGAHWGIAVQWGRKHEYGQANNLVVPFFDDVIRARYPADALPLEAPVKLADYPAKAVWLGDAKGWNVNTREGVIAPLEGYKGDVATQTWMTSHRLAATWQAFVGERAGVTIQEPAGMGDKQEFAVHTPLETLVIKVDVGANKTPRVELFDGETHLAKRAEAPFEFPVTLASGIHPLYVVVHVEGRKPAYSRPHTIVVSAATAK